jgi:hypothetical protein
VTGVRRCHPGRFAGLAAAGTLRRHVRHLAGSASVAGAREPDGSGVGSRFGGLSPILLTAGWLVAGVLQPASYSPVRETVSVLATHQEPTGGS